MTLARKRLRDAAKTALRAIPGLTVDGPRAFLQNLDRLPSAGVLTTEEGRSRLDKAGTVSRRIDLAVRLRASGDDVDDRLDALAEQVEAALMADATLQEITGDDVPFEAVAASFVLTETAGDAPVAQLTLMFVAEVLE